MCSLCQAFYLDLVHSEPSSCHVLGYKRAPGLQERRLNLYLIELVKWWEDLGHWASGMLEHGAMGVSDSGVLQRGGT